MADKEYIFEKIERYLQGEMNPEERTDFERELRKDSELQKKYELHVAANELLLERRLQKVRAKTKAHSNKKISSGKTLIYATTTLVGLALLSTIFFYTTSTTSEDGGVLTTDSIIINTSKKPDDLRKVITKQDSSAYDTLVKNVQNRDKSPTSRVDVIYKGIQEQDKKDSLQELQPKKKQSEVDTTVQDQVNKKSVSTENTNESKPTNQQKPISCEDYVLHFDVDTKNTCAGEETGSASIQVENKKTAPYQFNITNEYDEEVNSSGLAKGSYSIYITDKNGCKSNSLGFYIEEDFCLDDYIINTSYQETLLLPKSENKYVFRVYDKTGQLYYTRKVEEQENLEWNGRNSNGQITPGYYLIQVELEQGDLKKGSITIKN